MTAVLHLIDTYRVGGPGKTILNSARFVDRARYTLHVAAFTPGSNGGTDFSRAVSAARIPFLDLRERGRLDASHASHIRAYVREHDIRLLHTHGYRSDVLGYVATRGLSSPALVTTHHGWIRNGLRQRLTARLAMLAWTAFDGIELVAEHLMGELPRAVRNTGRVEVVRNAVVLGDYDCRGGDEVRRSLGLTAEHRVILVVGRLSLEKGCLEMIDAFESIAKRIPDAHLLFVGEGPLGAALRTHAAARGVAARVHFAPHQLRVAAFYDAADLVVSPSRTEGLSNVILEALTMRKAVVATKVGGNGEIIRDGVSGLLVPSERPPALADSVVRVLSNARLRAELAANGRQRVETVFAFETRMRTEEHFYDRVLAGA